VRSPSCYAGQVASILEYYMSGSVWPAERGRKRERVGTVGSTPYTIPVHASPLWLCQRRWGGVKGCYPGGQLYCLGHSRIIIRRHLDCAAPSTIQRYFRRTCARC
jgi:hypothetical protein